MQCEEIKELLSSYLDNELSEAERQLVDAHILGCADCAGALSRLRKVAREVGEMPRLKLPEEAAGRLAAAVEAHLAAGRTKERREKPAPRWQWFARPAFISAAATVGAVAVAVVVWQGAAEKTDLKMESAPIKQEAPEAAIKKPGSGARSVPGTGDFSPPVFTKKHIDELATAADAQADAGRDRDWGLTAAPKSAGIGETVEAAARLAAGNRPAVLVSATQALFEDRLVWVVVVELNEGGKRIAAAVAIDDGRLLYQSR